MNKLITISVSIFLILSILLSSSATFAMLGEQGSDKMMEEYQNMTKFGKSDSFSKNLWNGFLFFISSTFKVFSDCQKNKAVKTDEALCGSSKSGDMQEIFISTKDVAVMTAEVNFSINEVKDTNANKINDIEKQKAIYKNFIEKLKNDN